MSIEEAEKHVHEAVERLALCFADNRSALHNCRRTQNYSVRSVRGEERNTQAHAVKHEVEAALFLALLDLGARLEQLYQQMGKSLSIDEMLECHRSLGISRRRLREAIHHYPEWFRYAQLRGSTDITVNRTGRLLEDITREALVSQ